MTANLWRLLTLPGVVLALLLIGSPAFPALERVLSTVFGEQLSGGGALTR
jgi:hypothetical protein